MQRKTFTWTLPREIEARLGESTYGRQRIIQEADNLLIILHSPPAEETHQREAHVFLRKPNGALMWNGQENGEIKLKRLLASYRELFEKYDEALESAHTATDLFTILEPLAPLNRASTHLMETLESARDAVKEDKFLIAMRDEAYELSRSFELLFTDAKLELEYRVAQNAEAQMAKSQEMARAQQKLNTLAAATFPLMALATVFGMNLANGLEAGPIFFWLVLSAAIGAGVLTMDWVRKH